MTNINSQHKSTYISHKVKVVLVWISLANLAVMAIKAFAGYLSGSLSVISDSAHSFTDLLNNIVGIILIRFSSKPPDDGHPYGHNKIEQIGAFGITGLMLFTAYEIGREAIVGWWIGEKVKVDISTFTISVMCGTLIVNIAVVVYERYAGRKLGSIFLIADAQHTLSDIYVTLGVLLGLLFVKLGYLWVDRIVAIVVVVAIAYGAFHVVRQAGLELMDAAAINPKDLYTLAINQPDIIAVHGIRSRGRGEYGFVEFTIIVNHNDLRRAHKSSDILEEIIREQYNMNNVTIHIEPNL